jgi:bifunctional non-homologous end joining protein LigD
MAFQRKKPAAIGFPGFIEPALATSIERVPAGERWIHEIKFDGYRVQLHLANEVDGEIVMPAADGTTDFSVLQNELRGKSDKLVMVAFGSGRWSSARRT